MSGFNYSKALWLKHGKYQNGFYKCGTTPQLYGVKIQRLNLFGTI
jgi:hypothetical protein